VHNGLNHATVKTKNITKQQQKQQKQQYEKNKKNYLVSGGSRNLERGVQLRVHEDFDLPRPLSAHQCTRNYCRSYQEVLSKNDHGANRSP